jgi:hypothetical protein
MVIVIGHLRHGTHVVVLFEWKEVVLRPASWVGAC